MIKFIFCQWSCCLLIRVNGGRNICIRGDCRCGELNFQSPPISRVIEILSQEWKAVHFNFALIFFCWVCITNSELGVENCLGMEKIGSNCSSIRVGVSCSSASQMSLLS